MTFPLRLRPPGEPPPSAPDLESRPYRLPGRLASVGRGARLFGVPLLLAAVVTAGTPGWGPHTIRRGDTLTGIAQRYDTTVARLVEVNNLPGNGQLIYAGRTLQVPTTRAATSGGGTTRSTTRRHRVRPGDTLSGIARSYGVTTASAARTNRLANAHYIRVGQVLSVPASTRSQPAATSAGTTRRAASSGNTFAGRTYPDAVVESAARNRATLEARGAPSRDRVRDLIVATSRRHGVDPALALAISWQESGWDHAKVSVANAIGAMQVIPASGDWASDILGRRLDLLDLEDNITAGVVILRVLRRSTADERHAVAAYYQGLRSVRTRGMFRDTRRYVDNVVALKGRFG